MKPVDQRLARRCCTQTGASKMVKKTAKKKVAKKVTKKTASRKSATSQMQDYASDIWLAGLGAFALAQKEGSRLLGQGRKALEETGNKVFGESGKLFERLIEEGSKVESRSREKAESVREEGESRGDKVREAAQSNWERLEEGFEQRRARALPRLGVPTSAAA